MALLWFVYPHPWAIPSGLLYKSNNRHISDSSLVIRSCVIITFFWDSFSMITFILSAWSSSSEFFWIGAITVTNLAPLILLPLVLLERTHIKIVVQFSLKKLFTTTPEYHIDSSTVIGEVWSGSRCHVSTNCQKQYRSVVSRYEAQIDDHHL